MRGIDARGIPNRNSEWVHRKNQIRYMVFDILNDEGDPERTAEYPVIVCYVGENGKKWGKTLDNFLEKMECAEPLRYPMSWTGRTPWIPYLVDRADGVKGHYAIGRWNPAGYQEVWNLLTHNWASFSDAALTLDHALEAIKGLRLPSDVPVITPWDARRERINTQAPIVQNVGFAFPPLKINVTNDRNYTATEGLWYFFDLEPLDAERACIAVRDTLSGTYGFYVPQVNSPLSRFDWVNGSSEAERYRLIEAGMNYVGPVPGFGPVMFGNHTARGGSLPELILAVTLMREVKLLSQRLLAERTLEESTWGALQRRAEDVLCEFTRESRIHYNSAKQFRFTSRNCTLHMTFPSSALDRSGAAGFDVAVVLDGNTLSFQLDDYVANRIAEVISLDWILL